MGEILSGTTKYRKKQNVSVSVHSLRSIATIAIAKEKDTARRATLVSKVGGCVQNLKNGRKNNQLQRKQTTINCTTLTRDVAQWLSVRLLL